jgi:MerR family transcriptional regulator/heat shock protein HspR
MSRAPSGAPAGETDPAPGDPAPERDLAVLYRQVLEAGEDASTEPVYVISVAAQLVGVHAQTLRHYERLGLSNPARTPGGIRLYSARDVTRLQAIARLTEELGLNLAGVEVLLELHRRMADMERQLEGLRVELRLMRGYLLEDGGGGRGEGSAS